MAFTPFPAVIPPETITDQPEKVTPVGPDELLIADSEAGAAAKKIQIANLLLLAGGGGLESGQIAESAQLSLSADYLETNGQTFDRTIETDLYAAIGNYYNLYETEQDAIAPVAVNGSRAGDRGCVAISNDGTKVAVATAPIAVSGVICTVYDWDGTSLTNPQVITEAFVDPVASYSTAMSCDISDDGTVLAIGVIQENTGGNTNAGAVYIYKLVLGTWTLDSRIIETVPTASAIYGTQVSLSGNGLKLVAGKSGAGTSTEVWADAGGGVWNSEGSLGSGSIRGAVLNQDGTVALVGDQATAKGNVEVWKYTGTWNKDQDLVGLLTGSGASDGIGSWTSFDISNDGLRAVVGQVISGNRAWYLESDGTSFSLKTQLTCPIDLDGFSSTSRISGDGTVLALGAYLSDTYGANSGAVITYGVASDGAEPTGNPVDKQSGTAGSFFGESLDIDEKGQHIPVGAGGDATGGSGRGRLHMVTGPARVPTLAPPQDGIIKVIKK